MGHDEAIINRAMFSTFKDRLEFDSLDHQVIIYSENRGYEYNFKSKKIRPFVSVLWFDVNHDDFKEFTEYFEFQCNDSIHKFEINGDESQAVPSSIGYLYDRYIVVDMDALKKLILSDDNYISDHDVSMYSLEKSCNDFFKYISKLYDNNELYFKEMIYNN